MTPSAIRRTDVLCARNTHQQQLLARRLFLALGPWDRTRGLLGRPMLAAGEAMLLRPCRGVHTFFMAYPIDVAFLDEAGVIVAQRPELRPWRLTPLFAEAYCALELPPGVLAASGTVPGDLIRFEPLAAAPAGPRPAGRSAH